MSAFIVGLAGGLYAHFLGILTVEMFYMDLNFISIAMFVFGGASSVTGAVAGVVVITPVTEILRDGVGGVQLGSTMVARPPKRSACVSSWASSSTRARCAVGRRRAVKGFARPQRDAPKCSPSATTAACVPPSPWGMPNALSATSVAPIVPRTMGALA